jgi:hypothetical protein
MLAADQQLFIVTAEGSILAFGAPQSGEPTVHQTARSRSASSDRPLDGKSGCHPAGHGVRDGYALVLGIDRGRLVEELVRQSDLHVIAVDDDAAKVAALRQRLDDAGLYAPGRPWLVGDPLTYPLAPYLASLVVRKLPTLGTRRRAQDLAEGRVPHVAALWRNRLCVGLDGRSSRIEQIVQAAAFRAPSSASG